MFRKKFRPSRSAPAFTLVELLVTLTIVILLATGIIALVGDMLRKGKEGQTISNLRQLGVGAMAYAADHDGRMVPHAIFDSAANVNREWCYGYGHDDPDTAFKEGILGPYLLDAQKVLTDPTFTYQGDKMEMVGPLGARPTTFGFGYNGFFLSRKLTSYGQWEGYPLATVEKPVETVMFATSAEFAGGKVRPYENIWPPTRLGKPVIRAVDGDSAFVCWVSGHVTRVKVARPQKFKGITLGHLEGPQEENLFDRFDGDKGDRR